MCKVIDNSLNLNQKGEDVMKNNSIQVFNNPEFGEIRTLTENDKTLFCATDIAKSLGYANPRKAIADHCRCVTKRDVPHPQSKSKMLEMSFIPEGDIYRLIAHSKLPSAVKFESWVFDEVLPSIQKHGAYMTPDTLDKMISSPEFGIKLLTALKEERDKNAELENEVKVLQPKATYCDEVLKSDKLIATTVIAKDYGWSGQKMNKVLKDKGIQYKVNGTWVLYQKYADKGYTGTQTYTYDDRFGNSHADIRTLWTQNGRLFIYEMLKNDNVLPLIEQTKCETGDAI